MYVYVIIIFILLAIFGRILFVFVRRRPSFCNIPRTSPAKTMIILGSGGHTSEMIRLITHLDTSSYSPRIYIMADSDTSSQVKIKSVEDNRTDYSVIKIPRSRIVRQSYFTSLFTTINSSLHCFPIISNLKPELVLCNGPGTCIPVCLVALFCRAFWLADPRIVFVESICRVSSLSLSGKILYWWADHTVVQWPQLALKYKRAVYLGRLV